MHYVAWVVVPNDVTRENAEEAVGPILAPYDENLEVAPRKVRIGAEEIATATKYAEYPSVTEALEDYYGYQRVGQDEDGYFAHNTRNEQGMWDWWVVGGRWTGYLSDYDPRADPANHSSKPCHWCSGKGIAQRAVFEDKPGDQCSNCRGRGTEPNFGYVPYDGDVVSIEDVLPRLSKEISPYAVVIPEGGWHAREQWTGSDFLQTPDWQEKVRELLTSYRHCKIVVVDFHS